jgi:hypothetical protein
MIRKFLPALVALGLLPGLLAAGSAVAGTTGSQGFSSTAVAAGTVTAASGAAMPGLTVDLYAWPSDAVVSALRPGTMVPMTLLASTTTDAAGGYSLIVPAARLAASAPEDGWANLEIDSPGGGLWFFSYPAGKQAGEHAATVTVNLGSSKNSHPWPCGYSAKNVAYGAVGPIYLHKRAPVWATVGQGYIVRDRQDRGDWVNFNYTEGSTQTQASHLGVGLSAYGLNAGYDHYGIHTSTATHTEGFTNSYSNALFQTMFKTGQFRFLCIASLPFQPVHRVKQNSPCPSTYQSGANAIPVHMCLWQVQSTGHFGGTQTLHPKRSPATPADNCAPHEGGPQSHYDGDYGTAVEWSSGWDLGADLKLKAVDIKVSFNASAQTGYDTNAVVYFHFARRSYLCGTNGSETSAAQLVARGNVP